VLRDQPAQSGAKLASVRIYDNVEVVDANTFQAAFQVKESSGLVIDGHWVQVRHKGKVGWVFDGYLLSFPPVGKFTDEAYWDQFGKVISKTDKPPKGSENLRIYSESKWDNGVHYTYERGEGGGAFTTKLPKALFSFSQAYLFATQEIPESEHPERWSFTYDQSEARIRASLEGEYREIVVEQDKHGNSLIIKSYGD
jgi:hypothetical protein